MKQCIVYDTTAFVHYCLCPDLDPATLVCMPKHLDPLYDPAKAAGTKPGLQCLLLTRAACCLKP